MVQYIIILLNSFMDPEGKNNLTWDGNQGLRHHVETDTFTLALELNNKKLAIDLMDLTNGVAYSKVVTDETLKSETEGGFEEIFDLFVSFTTVEELSQILQGDAGHAKKTTKKTGSLIRYKFGDKICKEDAFFCIRQNGVIEIVWEIEVGTKIKRKKVFSSTLKLEKKREITEKDLFNIKIVALQREFDEKLQNNLIEMKKQFETINQQLRELKEQNKIYKREQNARKSYLLFQKNIFSSSFSFNSDNYSITKTSANQWVQLTYCRQLPYNEVAHFKIKPTRMVSRNLMIGVTDKKVTNGVKTIYANASSIAYCGNNGQVYANGAQPKSEGGGFLQDNIVQVQVELSKGEIRWKIDGVLKCSYANDWLKKADAEMCPFVEFHNQYDMIQWCPNEQ